MREFRIDDRNAEVFLGSQESGCGLAGSVTLAKFRLHAVPNAAEVDVDNAIKFESDHLGAIYPDARCILRKQRSDNS
jgi:hypothetical protein